MKQNLLTTLVLVLCFSQYSKAQIQYTGCIGAISGNYPYTLNLSSTIDDAGTIRNTYESTSAPCSLSSACAFQVLWNPNNSYWEIRNSTDGGASFINLLYINPSASIPNPPDLTLGTWAGQGPCSPDNLAVFSGDSQSGTLGVSSLELENKIGLSPNPANKTILVSGLSKTHDYSIYNSNGLIISKGSINNNEKVNIEKLTAGFYFLKLDNGNTIKFIKK